MILETSILNPLKFLEKIFKADILLLGLTLEFAISKHIEIYTELHPSGLNFTLLTFEVRCCDINKCSSVFFLSFIFIVWVCRLKLSEMFIGKSATKLQHLSDINHQTLSVILLCTSSIFSQMFLDKKF